MRPAVFLDRDGTILDEVGYVTPDSLVAIYPWGIDAIRLLKQAGFVVAVITNQGGIARGFYTAAFVDETHRALGARFAAGGAAVDAWFYCPHHPEAIVKGTVPYPAAIKGTVPFSPDKNTEGKGDSPCACRKPEPGMVHEAQRAFDLDLTRSWVIGDQWRDVQVAHTVGARSILVRTGHGQAQEASWPADLAAPTAVCDNLIAAVALLLS